MGEKKRQHHIFSYVLDPDLNTAVVCLSICLSIIYLYLSAYLSIYLFLLLSPSLLKVGDINTKDTVWATQRAASW